MGFLSRLIPARFRKKKVKIPVVRLSGVIQAGGSQFRPALNLANIEDLLEEAFETKKAPAVAIAINSPGGSPVQSRQIFYKIRALAEKHEKKVLVFVEDVAASGGYLIALAGDEIIADPTSIVGSIGVISGGFGFTELIKKVGVERRIYTAGQNKSVLDPFLPEKESDVAHLKSLQLDVHRVFIDMVKERRAGKLAEDDTLFTGLFWSGEKGLALGLVDALGDMETELRLRYGDEVEIEPVEASRGFVARMISGRSATPRLGGEIGAGAAEAAISTAEERLWWSRYGL
ncbi:S49 family peptidase [Rhizobium sp. TRM95796]|uniref:S49 family peptidase n=1 Tax=Rhizobium sp. TRM95796 TaxID=2979862 RepID=UPI0021E81181|nr:S49 family peptidase [Rhizobium sp. TRM95796]MCV3766329.1 S49 family peptidase [Rhizobium sp. TRM95796]